MISKNASGCRFRYSQTRRAGALSPERSPRFRSVGFQISPNQVTAAISTINPVIAVTAKLRSTLSMMASQLLDPLWYGKIRRDITKVEQSEILQASAIRPVEKMRV